MPINPNYILKQVGNDYMILPINNGNVDATVIFNTNETGAYIFNKLKDGNTVDEIIQMMLNEYEGITYDICKADVEEFVNKLKEKGIYND